MMLHRTVDGRIFSNQIISHPYNTLHNIPTRIIKKIKLLFLDKNKKKIHFTFPIVKRIYQLIYVDQNNCISIKYFS